MSAITRIKTSSVLPRLSRMSAKNTGRFPFCKIAVAVNLAGSGNAGKSRARLGDSEL